MLYNDTLELRGCDDFMHMFPFKDIKELYGNNGKYAIYMDHDVTVLRQSFLVHSVPEEQNTFCGIGFDD